MAALPEPTRLPKITRRIKVEVKLTEHNSDLSSYGGSTVVEAETTINLPVPNADAVLDLIRGQVEAILSAAQELPVAIAVLDPSPEEVAEQNARAENARRAATAGEVEPDGDTPF